MTNWHVIILYRKKIGKYEVKYYVHINTTLFLLINFQQNDVIFCKVMQVMKIQNFCKLNFQAKLPFIRIYHGFHNFSSISYDIPHSDIWFNISSCFLTVVVVAVNIRRKLYYRAVHRHRNYLSISLINLDLSEVNKLT